MTRSPRTILRAIGGRLLLALGVPLALFAAAEGILRGLDAGLPVDFLLPGRSPDQAAWTGNPFYGYRFFPPAMARNPPPLACARPKPPGTVRIVVLGESAAMGDPLVEFGAPRLLGKMLNHAGGATRFEVINAAMTAINSPVIADIASELRRLEPDAVIIYMGNNEVVGPFGPTARQRSRLGTRLVPLRVALTRWRSLQSLRLAILSLLQAGRDPRYFQMDALGRLALRADDPRLGPVYDLYENRLGRILDLARNAGAEVLLSTMAVNRTACPPFGSANRSDWTEDRQRRWQQAYDDGITAQAEGRRADALAHFQAAAQSDDGHAELAFRLAQTLAAAGEAGEAARWFTRARDADTRRFRADSRINRIIRDLARRRKVRLVDAETAFLEDARDDALFLDHVHFTFAGTYRLASLWFNELCLDFPDLERPSLETCRERMLFTPWGERRQARSMAARLDRPPFTGRLDNDRHRQALADTIERCSRTIAVTNLYALRTLYPDLVARDPHDPFYPLQWGSILLESQKIAEAQPLLTDYMEHLPRHFEARIMPAYILAKTGRPGPAAELLLGAGPPYGRYLADHSLGVIESLLADGFRREARQFGQAILERRRSFSGRKNLAAVVERL